jgi:prevent-host-death family protein
MLLATLERWTLQDAKNRFSDLVRLVLADGPRVVTRGRHDAVVVLAADEYERLTRPEESLVDFLQKSPLANVQLDFDRPRNAGRPIHL